jgi:hypothetical protein
MSTGGAILTTLERDEPIAWLDDYPKAIDALTVEEVNSTTRWCWSRLAHSTQNGSREEDAESECQSIPLLR